MQLIFLFETNKKSKSDYKYVRSYLTYVGLDRKFKFSPIYMNGKGNYDKFEYQINSLNKENYNDLNNSESNLKNVIDKIVSTT